MKKISIEKEYEQVTELQKMYIIKNCPHCGTKIKYNIANVGIYSEELKYHLETVFKDCVISDFDDICKNCGKKFTLAIVSPSKEIVNKVFSNLIPLEEGKTLDECINSPVRCSIASIKQGERE